MASRETSTRFHPYKKAKPTTTTSRESTSGLSINDLKRRIRDVKRLLGRHADLSPEARIVQERALAGYEKDLKDETERRQRSEMIKRYHFVRFLGKTLTPKKKDTFSLYIIICATDRKTATKELRRLTQKQKTVEEEENDKKGSTLKAIKNKIHIAQINVNYTIYYPLSEKYISLYPQDKKKKTSATSDDEDEDGSDSDELLPKSGVSKNEKPPLWAIVEKCTANGTLDKLRNGKLNVGFDGKPKSAAAEKRSDGLPSSSQTTREKAASKKAQKYENEDDDDSDGGFFET
jgi:hypothetical protein